MCGLVGVAGNLYQKDLDVFKDLLMVDTIRGLHSTGVAVVESDWNVEVIKCAGSPLVLRGHDNGKLGATINMQCRVLIGHNRHATIGAITDDNAHPYEYEHIVGAHNGTLHGRSASKLDHFNTYGTDSAALYGNINDKDVREVIPEMDGAWALTWYDKRDKTINFLRNDQRPLHYAFNHTGSVMYWASEAGMLRWILGRNNVKVHETGILSLNVDKLVRWAIPTGNQIFGEPAIEDLEGHRATFFRGGYGAEWQGEWETEAEALARVNRVVEKWSPSPRGSNARSSSNRSLPVKLLNGPDVKPDNSPFLGTTTGQLNLPSSTSSTEDGPSRSDVVAAELGFVAGCNGRSVNSCPYHVTSSMARTWRKARLKGLEQYKQPDPNAPTVPSNMVRGFNGVILNEQAWRNLTGGCCTVCQKPVSPNAVMRFVDRTRFICDPCVNQDELTNELNAAAA